MGGNRYDSDARSARTNNYSGQSINSIFEQQKRGVIHESMNPNQIVLRECRDSEVHPNTIPVVVGMDVTGSMGKIPHSLVQKGLPTLMSKLIEKGVDDASLLFTAVGDHISDDYPLQVGQFESGDVELDMWLTRTYLEGNGGGNGGESYCLVWDFVNRFVKTDAWEKRQQKGFVFTFGDEPFHQSLPASFLKSLYKQVECSESVSLQSIMQELEKKWHFFHIHIGDRNRGDYVAKGLEPILKEHLILCKNYTEIPNIIADKILEIANISNPVVLENKPEKVSASVEIKEEVEML
jgi:hypothetical protein